MASRRLLQSAALTNRTLPPSPSLPLYSLFPNFKVKPSLSLSYSATPPPAMTDCGAAAAAAFPPSSCPCLCLPLPAMPLPVLTAAGAGCRRMAAAAHYLLSAFQGGKKQGRTCWLSDQPTNQPTIMQPAMVVQSDGPCLLGKERPEANGF